MSETSSPGPAPQLQRGLGLLPATALNVANMVGIGPFITIPMFIGAMQGPQALIGWVIAALLVLCDGLVWSELGAALPGSGGSYHFLSEIFGRYRWGRLLPFLFIWQFLVSGTLELASGYLGGVQYLEYALPWLPDTLRRWGVPGGSHSVAAASALVVTLMLCRNIRSLGRLGVILAAGTLITVTTVIVAGLWHFDPELLAPPPDAWKVDGAWLGGLGAAMAIAVYDYLGYYNVCHLGDEVIDPGKTIPRAVLISVVLVAAIYLTMNLSIIAVVPWQKAMHSENVAAQFMEQLFGRPKAVAFTWLILWTVIACVYAMTLGYSRIPYAAAKGGGFIRAFGVLHPVHKYPVVSLAAIGGLTALFCYFPLEEVIFAAVTVRIAVQFMGQIIGLHLLRRRRPETAMPFRMWFYPLPSLVALAGWTFLLVTAKPLILYIALGVLLSGVVAYGIWQTVERWRSIPRAEWLDWYMGAISGQDESLAAGLTRTALTWCAVFYAPVARFLIGRQQSVRAPLPVISIGNLTVGGTGKTPLAAYLARWFRARGVRVCILSRGYGAGDTGVNDEALVLEQLCPDVPNLQHPDRIASATIACEELESQLLILDDGFQHRRLARDLDLVLVDALNPWGYGRMFPRGLLREPLTALRRAHLVIITRVDQVSPQRVAAIHQRIADIDPRQDVVEVAFPPERLINVSGNTAQLETLRDRPVAAFCGIGNPQAFRASLERLGLQVVAFRPFPDHHQYTPTDRQELDNWVRAHDVAAVLTTQKDLVKWGLDELGGAPLWGVQIGTQVVRGGDRLEWHLQSLALG
ncbi:MAG: tetraacyldisaccharide 4'-kinase [Planctomycetales bacterium]